MSEEKKDFEPDFNKVEESTEEETVEVVETETEQSKPDQETLPEVKMVLVNADSLTTIRNKNKELSEGYTKYQHDYLLAKKRNEEMMADLMTVIKTFDNIQKELNLDMSKGMSGKNIRAGWKLISKLMSDDEAATKLIDQDFINMFAKYSPVYEKYLSSQQSPKKLEDGK